MGVDDDGDGSIDEGPERDDDEDGEFNEDWVDPVVYEVINFTLKEWLPEIGSTVGGVFVKSVIAEGVTDFDVRLLTAGLRTPLLEITLELTDSKGETFSLTSKVRVRGGS